MAFFYLSAILSHKPIIRIKTNNQEPFKDLVFVEKWF